MARTTFALFLIAIGTIGFIEGCFNRPHVNDVEWKPAELTINTLLEYKRVFDGSCKYHPHVRLNAGAHHDVLGEAKRWAHCNIDRIQFTDENDNVIVLGPNAKRLYAKFTRGDLFNKLPSDYIGYDIIVLDKDIITGADKSAVTQWPTTSDVNISDRFGAPIRLT